MWPFGKWWSEPEVAATEAGMTAEAPTYAHIPNHPFAPGAEVGFHPAHAVTVERGLRREPISLPVGTTVVSDDGTLEASGLPKGRYCAAGPLDDRYYAYVQFTVR